MVRLRRRYNEGGPSRDYERIWKLPILGRGETVSSGVIERKDTVAQKKETAVLSGVPGKKGGVGDTGEV